MMAIRLSNRFLTDIKKPDTKCPVFSDTVEPLKVLRKRNPETAVQQLQLHQKE